ncbi:MAG: 50S ribosomal protein L13 [bacterium]
MKTYFARKEDELDKKWYVVDAEGKILGRLASEVAKVLRGKNKPIFTPHVDTGDFVVVVNAEKVKLTGKKTTEKVFYHYSGYLGGLRSTSVEQLLARRPEELIRRAVKGMLPKNRLGRQLINKLKVYKGPEHPHQAQRPAPLNLGSRTASVARFS